MAHRATAVWIGLALLAGAQAASAAESMGREFKMPLRTEPFVAQPDAAGSVYTRQLTLLIKQAHGVDVLPVPKREKVRTVQFLDTYGACRIRSANFILRVREDDKGRRQLTLKTRSPDADWVRRTELVAAGGGKTKSKLEEDILPPDRSQLSRSVTLTLAEGDAIPISTEAAAKIFPVLGSLPPTDLVGTVEGMVARERAYVLPKWQVGNTSFEAEIALWLTDAGKVLFAETSFKYQVPENDAEAKAAAEAAQKLFAVMQADTDWAGKLSVSKTDYIYNSAGGKFCKRTFGNWGRKGG